MKRVSDKPKRSKYTNSTEYERALKRWKRWQVKKFGKTDPAKLSGPLLRTILSEHNILQAGCRELQEFRLRAHQNGRLYRKGGDNRPNLAVPTRFEYECPSWFVLGLPTVLWREILLKHLDVFSLFSLLKVCKVFYALANEELFKMARLLFHHERATPFALVAYHRILGAPYDYQKANLLKVPLPTVRQTPPEELIRLAIERHGYVDHLLHYVEEMSKRSVAEFEEDLFITERMPARVAECNAALKAAGYHFTVAAPCDDLLTATCDWNLLRELRDYVRMEHTRRIGTIITELKHPVVYETLQDCNLDVILGRFRFGFSYLLRMISKPTFFGRQLSPIEIGQYTLSIYRLVRDLDTEENAECIWDDNSVRLVYKPDASPYFHHHSYHFTGP